MPVVLRIRNFSLSTDIDLPKVRAERYCDTIMTSRVLLIQRLDLKMPFLGGREGGTKLILEWIPRLPDTQIILQWCVKWHHKMFRLKDYNLLPQGLFQRSLPKGINTEVKIFIISVKKKKPGFKQSEYNKSLHRSSMEGVLHICSYSWSVLHGQDCSCKDFLHLLFSIRFLPCCCCFCFVPLLQVWCEVSQEQWSPAPAGTILYKMLTSCE